MIEQKTYTFLRKAIAAKCRECLYDDMDRGTWQEQVARCTAPKCPLFELRPLPRGQRHPWDTAPPRVQGPLTPAQQAVRDRFMAMAAERRKAKSEFAQ